jgi:replicative DNA helicase
MNDVSVPPLKVMPHSVEAEKAVLGGLLINNAAWEQVADKVTQGDFYIAVHQQLFTIIAELTDKDRSFDLLTFQEELKERGLLETIGGFDYLQALVDETLSIANIVAYADIVRERAILRRLIQASTDISDSAFDPQGRDARDIVGDAEKRIAEIVEGGPKDGGPEHVNPIMSRTLDKIEELFNQDGNLTGITTGFVDLDNRTNGLQPADMVIVAARPSMGKTTLAMNIVENAVVKSGKPALVFSMEMPKEAILFRMYSSLGRIDQGRLRSGRLTEEDWPKLTTAFNMLKDKPLYIDDTAALTPQEMRSRCRQVYRQHAEIGVIMVDYLQLMRVSGKSEGRTQEISEISRSLKAIAKEFNCPVIALSQLNRSLEQRPNKRPVMSDLRESGAIEQDADIIAFIYRDEVYNEESQEKGVAEIIIGKHRNGEIGTDRLAFLGKYTRFENLARGYDDGI